MTKINSMESFATEDDTVALYINRQFSDMELTVDQARALAADLIETCDYIARTTAADQAAQA